MRMKMFGMRMEMFGIRMQKDAVGGTRPGGRDGPSCSGGRVSRGGDGTHGTGHGIGVAGPSVSPDRIEAPTGPP